MDQRFLTGANLAGWASSRYFHPEFPKLGCFQQQNDRGAGPGFVGTPGAVCHPWICVPILEIGNCVPNRREQALVSLSVPPAFPPSPSRSNPAFPPRSPEIPGQNPQAAGLWIPPAWREGFLKNSFYFLRGFYPFDNKLNSYFLSCSLLALEFPPFHLSGIFAGGV